MASPFYILQIRCLYEGKLQVLNESQPFASLDDVAEAFGDTDAAFRVLECTTLADEKNPNGSCVDVTLHALRILAWRSFGHHKTPHYEVREMCDAYGVSYYREREDA